MAEFGKVKSEEEIESELEKDIRNFLKDIDRIMRVSSRIPATNYIRFDPYLFLMWKNGNN